MYSKDLNYRLATYISFIILALLAASAITIFALLSHVTVRAQDTLKLHDELELIQKRGVHIGIWYGYSDNLHTKIDNSILLLGDDFVCLGGGNNFTDCIPLDKISAVTLNGGEQLPQAMEAK